MADSPKRLVLFNTATDTYYLVKMDTDISVVMTGGPGSDKDLTDLIHLLLDTADDLNGQLSLAKRDEVAKTLREVSIAVNGAHTLRSSIYISVEQNAEIISMLEDVVNRARNNLVALLAK